MGQVREDKRDGGGGTKGIRGNGAAQRVQRRSRKKEQLSGDSQGRLKWGREGARGQII